jgi:O-antigen ligase
VWFWILRAVCRDRTDFYRVLRAWKVSSIATASAAILGYVGVAFVSDEAGSRQVGLSGHPNHLAGQLAATFFLFLLAAPRQSGEARRGARFWWLVALGLTATAMFSSGSITGVIAIAVGGLVTGGAFLVTRTPASPRRVRSPLAPVAVLLVLTAGTAALLTSDLPVVDRIVRYREGDTYVTGSVSSRGDRNSIVLERFDRYLVVGLGFTHETVPTRTSADPDDPAVRSFGVHNMYLGLLYQAGLAAVVGTVLILIAAWRQLSALLRRTDAELYVTTLALVGCLTAVAATSMFQPIAFDRFFWMPVAMTGCLWSVRRRELRDAATSSAPRVPTPAD